MNGNGTSESELRESLGAIALATRPDIDLAWRTIQERASTEIEPERNSTARTLVSMTAVAAAVIVVALITLVITNGDDADLDTATTTSAPETTAVPRDENPPMEIPLGAPQPFSIRLADSAGMIQEVERDYGVTCVDFTVSNGARQCTRWYDDFERQYRAADRTLVSVRAYSDGRDRRATAEPTVVQHPTGYPSVAWVVATGVTVEVTAMPGPYDVMALVDDVVIEPMDTSNGWYLVGDSLYGDATVGGDLCVSYTIGGVDCSLTAPSGGYDYTIKNTGNRGRVDALVPADTTSVLIETSAGDIEALSTPVRYKGSDVATTGAVVLTADIPAGSIIERVVAIADDTEHELTWQPAVNTFPGQPPIRPGAPIPGGPIVLGTQELFSGPDYRVWADIIEVIQPDGSVDSGWTLHSTRRGTNETSGLFKTPDAQVSVVGFPSGLLTGFSTVPFARAVLTFDNGAVVEATSQGDASLGVTGVIADVPEGAPVFPAPKVAFLDAEGTQVASWPPTY